MSFYTNTLAAIPYTTIRAQMFVAEFDSVQSAFDQVKVYTDELTAARQGQASLLVNLQRYVGTAAPAPGNVDLGGNLMRNGGTPVLPGDLTNKGYVDGLVITATAPQWIPTEATVNKTLVPFESCTVKAPGVEIQLPAAPTYGVTRVRIRVAVGASARVMRNGLPIQATDEDMDMTSGQWCELQAESATEGWVIA